MARPEKFPRWATSEDATLEEPSEEAKDLGHVPNTVLTARLANWLQNLVYEWLVYLDEEVAGGGGGGGAASALQTTGASVDVAAAAPPVAGQVLMAIDAEHAQWKVPGLHYDSAIRFWIESAGEATIEPGTWGFVYQTPVGSSGVTVFVVSSLTSPPVDSRIGLYVSPIVDVPVTVSLIGASQIMGLDGTLASSITLRPGAMYEWVFYHEASVAIWGLVSDTAHVAKAIATTGDPVDVSTSAPPTPGQVLLAVSPTEAEWTTLPDSGMTYGGESNTCAIGEWVTTFTNGGAISIPSSAAEGDTFGVHVQFSGQNKHITVPTDQELQLEGRRYAEGETVALRAGAYYEWSAVAVGEGLIRWLPRASHHTLTPPLERADPALNPPMANQLVYGSDTDPVTLPGLNQNLKDGDSFAVLVDAGCDITVPSGVRLYAIDMSTFVDGPGTLTLFASTYHEWIYHADLAYWLPRESGVVSQAAIEDAFDRDASASVNMGGKVLSSVGTPVVGTDAATMAYADSAILAGIASQAAIKQPVKSVSTSNIVSMSGPTTVNGVSCVAGDRVLLTSQTTQSLNGIWVVQSGAWTRATDFDTSDKVKSACIIPCSDGNEGDGAWMLSTANPITPGTTNLTFVAVMGARATNIPSDVGAPSGAATPGTAKKWALEDHVHQVHSLDVGFNGYRISNNSTGIPTDSTASAVTLAAFTGNRISLTNSAGGASWVPCTPASNPTVSLSGLSAGVPADVFAVFGSTTSVTLELANWTNATTRATALQVFNGVVCKSGDARRRYVGTIVPDSATTFTHRSAGSDSTKAVCGIWNQDNRIRSAITWHPTFTTWSPGAATTWEPLGGGAGPHIEMVAGQGIDSFRAEAIAAVSTGADSAALAIGLDSTTAPSGFRHSVSASGAVVGLSAHLAQRPSIGRRTINVLAYGTTTGPVFTGASGAMQAGLTLDVWH